jgi:hypothetical protein
VPPLLTDADIFDELAPLLRLAEMEERLAFVAVFIGQLDDASHDYTKLVVREEQCRAALTACRRQHFSPTLRGSLSEKVLALAYDARESVLAQTRHLRARASEEGRPQTGGS